LANVCIGDLLERILIKHRPTNYVPQVSSGVATEIGKKSDVFGKLQELRLNDIAHADITCGHDGCP
jgi:hypothetical protein